MGKSVTQKRRREAEADQERRQEAASDSVLLAAKAATEASSSAPASASATPRPSKKARVEERRSLFVRSLPATATSEKLTEFFSEHFPVKHATVVTDPQTKVSRGFGFVTFTDAEDAAEAKAKLDNAMLDGRRLRLDIAEPRNRPGAGETGSSSAPASAAAKATAKSQKAGMAGMAGLAGTNGAADRKAAAVAAAGPPPPLIVRNLPWSVRTAADLEALFRMHGKVKFADLPKSKGGKLSGFGFVTLRGRKNAERALEAVNGKVVDGRTIAVDWAVDKKTWAEQQGAEGADGGKEEKGSKKKGSKTEAEAEEEAEPLDEAEADLRNFMKNTMENLEDEEDDEEEDDEDEDKDDDNDETKALGDDNDETKALGDDNDETKALGDDNDWEDEKTQDKPAEAKPLMTDTSGTIFVRNLPFTTTDADLKQHFAQFGPLRYARIVMDRATERPAGTGFVCFVQAEDASACLRGAPRRPAVSAVGKPSVLQDERIDRDGRYTMDGRVLQLAQAVSRHEASGLGQATSTYASAHAASAAAAGKDKRRLYLLAEGTIPKSSPLYAELPPAEIQLREASAKQRQAMVKANPSLHMSLTRLAVRNIPRHIDSKGLKELARRAIVGFATDVKEGLREPLTREELARGGQQDREAEQRRRAKGVGVVKQAKVVFESPEGTKLLSVAEGGKSKTQQAKEAAAGAKSRGYGFIEYWSHRWALSGLRWLNGHPVRHETGNKTSRLVVEFAIENANVVARRRANEDRARAVGRTGSGIGGVTGKKMGHSHTGGGADGWDSIAEPVVDGRDARGKNHSGGSQGRRDGKPAVGKRDRAEASGSSADTAESEKGGSKKDKKLALRQQIIGRKRMMRKKKSVARRG